MERLFLSLVIFSSVVKLISADHGHTILDQSYCSQHFNNSYKKIALNDKEPWIVTWTGQVIGTGHGGYCGALFYINRSQKFGSWKICVTPDVLDVTDCDVKIKHYAYRTVTTEPLKVLDCNSTKNEQVCTYKDNLLITIESTEDTSSNVTLQIRALYMPNKGHTVRSNYLVLILIVGCITAVNMLKWVK